MIRAAAPPVRRAPTAPQPAAWPPDHISPTSAKSYLACPLRFQLEKVLKVRKPVPPALHVGKSVHAALQAFHLARWHGKDHTEPVVVEAYENAFVRLERDEGPVNHSDAAAREKARTDGLRVVRAYLGWDGVPVEKPRGVEVRLSARIPGLPVKLTGTVDLVGHDYTPTDFKTAASRQEDGNAAFDHELQLVCYQMLVEQSAGLTPPSLDLVLLVKTKEPQVARVSVEPAGARRRQRAIAMLAAAWDGMVSNRFHPQPGLQCCACQFKPECRAWTGGGPHET